MRSTICIDPDCLWGVLPMLAQLEIKVIGSAASEDGVCLVIEGDIVPDLPKVMINVDRVIGKQYATLTARCIPDGEAIGSKENHDAHLRQPG